MAEIEVAPLGDSKFRVVVAAHGSKTSHVVTVGPAEQVLVDDGVADEELVVASFRFLLDRESKESIMSTFDLSVISRYFPEYPSLIGDYL